MPVDELVHVILLTDGHTISTSPAATDFWALHAWLAARVQEVRADTWAQVARRLSRLGYWESEDYRT